jgi:hypothetical protein
VYLSEKEADLLKYIKNIIKMGKMDLELGRQLPKIKFQELKLMKKH